MTKFASLMLLLCGSLLLASGAAAQDAYRSAPTGQPAYGSPAPGAVPAGDEGRIRDRGPHRRRMMASAQTYMPWRFGIGIGLRLAYEIPILHDGFIPSINDSFSIEPSMSFAWNTYSNGYYYLYASGNDVNALEYTPAVAALWSFYFLPNLRAYMAFQLGITILKPYYSGDLNYHYNFDTYYRVHAELAPGVVYNFTDRIGVRAEIGWWSGIKAGIAIMI